MPEISNHLRLAPLLLFTLLIKYSISTFVSSFSLVTRNNYNRDIHHKPTKPVNNHCNNDSRSSNRHCETNSNQRSSRCVTLLQGGFLDDFFQNIFSNEKEKSSNQQAKQNELINSTSNEDDTKDLTSRKAQKSQDTMMRNDINNDEGITWSESDFRNEVQKRRENSFPVPSQTAIATATKTDYDDDSNSSSSVVNDYDGYALRDAIYEKWGYCYDLEFQPVQSFGFKELYLNVLPFHLGGRRFRHKSEFDYLCHLQAVVEILIKYDQLDYVLAQLQETKKKPRAGTSPLVAVPFRLDLTDSELNSILA